MHSHNTQAYHRGLGLALLAQLIWGVAALYWAQTRPVEATDLLSHRVLWSLPVLAICVTILKQWPQWFAVFRSLRSLGVMGLCAGLAGLNWGIFLWAVTHGQAAQASMGYFLLPLINIAIGLLFFRETLDARQKVAVACAVAAVMIMVQGGQGIPYVALGVSLSFGIYSAIRKGVSVGGVVGLLVEIQLLAPIALWWFVTRDGAGLGRYGLSVDGFLLGSGLLTAVPLMAYVSATRLMPLSAMGLLSYLAPTTQLIVAITLLGESITQLQIIAFALVWLGLAVAHASQLKNVLLLGRREK